jgi:hypothetical protein
MIMNGVVTVGEEGFMERQNKILEDKLEREKIPAEKVLAVVLENATLLRLFANHFPDELRNEWEKALVDGTSLALVESRYEEFHDLILDSLGYMDPEAETALTDAIDQGNVDTVTNIIETHFSRISRVEE